MDHLDTKTLKHFPSADILLPQRSEKFLNKKDKERAIPLTMGQSIRLGSLTIDVVPALHGGWRFPWQKNYFACGYVISDGTTTVYYAGDSAYGTHFKKIGQDHAIDIALLPIGSYSPRWFLKTRHMNPPEAIRAFRDLNATYMIPCHFGCFQLSLEKLNEPLPWFATAAKNEEVDWQLPIGFSSNL